MRLEDFAKALAEQARKDVSAAVEAATKALGERIASLSDEADDLRAENAALSKSLEAVSARLAEAEAKAGEVVDVRVQIEKLSSGVDELAGEIADSVRAANESINSIKEQGDTLGADLGRLTERLAEVEAREPVPGPQGERGEKGDPGAPGAPGADGVGLAGALIDRDGQLVVTLTNGETKALGPVVGKDGAPGKDGAAGRDALDLEDFDAEVLEDGRTIRLTLARGETRLDRTLKLAVPIYREIYRPEEAYEKGDAVTYGGCLWVATDDAPEGAPGEGKGWRLAVKKGRDGRNGNDPASRPARVSVGGE